ncbi:betain reductase complex component B subunit alpha and beta [Oxobacter pfennigii]|uniref:Betain reductase complex component B subunit alpha and beta n=1 Tax=Oxobacter pfennigii TaxID=36849 RepID=A0A0P8WP07_9CLOT|nr:glycine/sarcosine/betaine reductase component B subunit [Oxobacter pfennigii]KPU44295.1 betain reductase complex component B subunit alpha and beta [Oxobacter pfennigii]
MHLEKRYVDVQKVVFDEKTFIEKGILHVCKKELIAEAMDFHFESVDFELAHPGESCRLTYVCDCVQPMYKTGEGAATFPGIADEVKRVGNGVSIVLRGVCITEIMAVSAGGVQTLDMSGPAAEQSYALPKLIHVCLLAKPAPGVQNDAYFDAVNIASKKVAKYVAKCAKDYTPDEVETFELKKEGLEDLPRVAYIFQIFSHAPLNDTAYYGDGCASMMPIVVHPNEILDGALVYRDYYTAGNSSPTYSLQNHPVILELIKRHGKDINFAGVIMSNTPAEIVNKNRNAMMCAGLAKYHLNADGVIITKQGGGHPQIDTGLNCDYCEELGIKTVLLLTEFLSVGNPITELVLFSTKNADAMVTNGCISMVDFPKVDRVVGIPTMINRNTLSSMDLYGPYTMAAYSAIRDFISQIGNTHFTSVAY